MKKEKIIANELQCMFIEGYLEGFNEKYINLITRKLWIGEITLTELLKENTAIKQKILEAMDRLRILNNQV